MSAKNLAQLSDRRDSSRVPIYKLLPLCIAAAEDNSYMSAQLADVSGEGLGILTSSNLAAGTLLTLRMLRLHIDFEVAWCRLTDNGDYFCGLVLKTAGINLEGLFRGVLMEACTP